MPNAIEDKIKEYEKFIEEKLKRDLRDVETLLTEKSLKYKEWKDVKTVVSGIKEFKEKDRDMLVQYDVGNGISAFGEISSYAYTYVYVGLGCMLEMDLEEADRYSDIRMKVVEKEINHLRRMAVNIKVHIKMVLLALNELQSTLGNGSRKK